MNPYCKNVNIFLAQKSIFSKKNFEKFKNFSKNYFKNLKILILMKSSDKSVKFQLNAIFYFRNLSKNSKKA